MGGKGFECQELEESPMVLLRFPEIFETAENQLLCSVDICTRVSVMIR